MDERLTITPDTPLQQVTALYPKTAVVLLKMGLHCVGCYISRFHTVADLAQELNVPLEDLVEALNRIARGDDLSVLPESLSR